MLLEPHTHKLHEKNALHFSVFIALIFRSGICYVILSVISPTKMLQGLIHWTKRLCAITRLEQMGKIGINGVCCVYAGNMWLPPFFTWTYNEGKAQWPCYPWNRLRLRAPCTSVWSVWGFLFLLYGQNIHDSHVTFTTHSICTARTLSGLLSGDWGTISLYRSLFALRRMKLCKQAIHLPWYPPAPARAKHLVQIIGLLLWIVVLQILWKRFIPVPHADFN